MDMLWNMCGVVNLWAPQAIRIAYHHRPPTMDLRNPYPPAWNVIRVRILERDNRTCQMCGATSEHLTVSHINRIEPDCRPANLWTLCRRCHLDYDRADNVRRRRVGKRAHLVQIPIPYENRAGDPHKDGHDNAGRGSSPRAAGRTFLY